MGRPPAERIIIANCFDAKPVLRYQHIRRLVDELEARPNLRQFCGFARLKDFPSEPRFSRVFIELSKQDLFTIFNGTMVKDYLGEELIGKVNRDSTTIKVQYCYDLMDATSDAR